MNHQEMNKAAYEAKFQTYIDTVPPVRGEFQNWLDKVLSYVATQETIFEIGSGAGKDGDYIRSKGYNLIESDFVDTFVNHLKTRGGEVCKLDILKNEIPGGPYKMIFANAVLLHFNESEMEMIIRKIKQALQDDGYLAIGLKHGQGDIISTHKFDMPRYFKFWTQDEITAFLKQNGFRVLDITFVEDKKWINVIAQMV